jgi:hypothetical protein
LRRRALCRWRCGRSRPRVPEAAGAAQALFPPPRVHVTGLAIWTGSSPAWSAPASRLERALTALADEAENEHHHHLGGRLRAR